MYDRIRGILFDVDGTLYHHARVRSRMVVRLARHCVGSPREARQLLTSLQCYRAAQETLRSTGVGDMDLAAEQLRLAAHDAGVPVETLADWVERWFEREPLALLGRATRPGMAALLARAAELGYHLGVVSDYPAEEKLASLRLRHHFAVTVAAQDIEVRSFKPNPRGLQVALERLGLTPEEAVYVGDRPEVDAVAAQRAGMRCIILQSRGPRQGPGYVGVRSVAELATILDLT